MQSVVTGQAPTTLERQTTYTYARTARSMIMRSDCKTCASMRQGPKNRNNSIKFSVWEARVRWWSSAWDQGFLWPLPVPTVLLHFKSTLRGPTAWRNKVGWIKSS